MKKLLLFVIIFLPIISFGQGKVTRQETNNASSQSTSTTKPNNKPTSNTKKRTTTTPIKISLAAELDGQRRYFSVSEWKNLSIEDRIKHNKIGIVIESGKESFLMGLNNNMETGNYDRTVPYTVAMNKSNGELPTQRQLEIIKNNYDAISSASKDFGGDGLNSKRFWCFEERTLDFYSNSTSTSKPGLFRPVTKDIENGFTTLTNIPSNVQECDYISNSNNVLKVARYKDKYGIVDTTNRIIASFKYDAIGCNYKRYVDHGRHKHGNEDMIIPDHYDLVSVCKNGKWGFVDRHGKEIVPLLYDEVPGYSYGDKLIWVKKEGRYGVVNNQGTIIIPFEYESEIEFYYDNPATVKKDGKWGFINKDGCEVIAFIYSSTKGFPSNDGIRYDGDLAPVSIDSKHGYIDKQGNQKIPLMYEFADEFWSGLAGVVMNGKLGFIDESGEIVIPCDYEVDYSYDTNDKKHLSLGMSFFSGDVALVKKNGYYGLINRKGENITPFKYGKPTHREGGSFDLTYDSKEIYIDRGGNVYVSKEERSEKSDSILATQGYTHEQYMMGIKHYKAKDYEKAYPWFKKSAEGGDKYGQCHLGYYFYNGYSPINQKDYALAFNWFSKAAQQGHRSACYFLGKMYEHGQGIAKDSNKAIEWYKKSNGQRDAEERIAKLSSPINKPLLDKLKIKKNTIKIKVEDSKNL